MAEELHGASGEWDEDGYHLSLAADFENMAEHPEVVVRSVPAMRELVAAVEPVRAHLAEHDRERAAYDAATPEERDRVLGRGEPPEDEGEAILAAADLARKARRENQ